MVSKMADSCRVNPLSDKQLLTGLLKCVSRAFYLTLRVLPERLRKPIGLAYLLARAADTLADTRVLPRADRARFLLSLRQQVQTGPDPIALSEMTGALTGQQCSEAENRLLQSLPQALELLKTLSPVDSRLVRSIVTTLTQGMEFDLTRFPDENSGQLRALDTCEELDHYTYMVAGCVGEFWTEISMAHISALQGWQREKMLNLGMRFGKALQMTNILRDVPADLKIGRSYLPKSLLATVDISPEDLTTPATVEQAQPILADAIGLTLDHFHCGKLYLLAIPRRCVRLRLAAAWPLLIGLGTLAVLAKNRKWLDPRCPAKVSRRWVYRMMLVSVVGIGSNGFMKRWIQRLAARVEREQLRSGHQINARRR